MSLIKYIEIPNHLWKGIHQTGSSIICNPPVIDTDIDFVISTEKEDELHRFLIVNGFNRSSSDEEEYDLVVEGFSCYRKDNINLIITTDHSWYKKWVNATKIAKKLNLLKKADRIVLFKFVLYDEV
jgi:hypothetical protein